VIALALAVWQRRRSECVTYYSVFEFPSMRPIGPEPDPDW
jgi:hypothetical protein